MIFSMTGFGLSQYEDEHLKIQAEVKSLNSKYLDLHFRLPRSFSSEKELELRSMINQTLERGKIMVTLDFQYKTEGDYQVNFNSAMAKAYYKNINQLAEELGAPKQDILRIVLMMPEVMNQDSKDPDKFEEEWEKIRKTLTEAIQKCNEFRTQEGKVLEGEFKKSIKAIQDFLEIVEKQDPKRIEQIKHRIQTKMQEIKMDEKYDQNRFEQEMIYYIEKIDISEEKVRLKNHLSYFVQTLDQANANGKKLNFISQEIGREINTIGAKANDSQIQHAVVGMKEELEKIKEQIANVL